MVRLKKRRKEEPEAATNPLLAADREDREHDAEVEDVVAAEPEVSSHSGAVAPMPAEPPIPEMAVPESPSPVQSMAYDDGGSSQGVASRVKGVYAGSGSTAAQRDAQAAAEFQAAIAPVMDMLSSAVPEAGSPDEAMRSLEQRLGEYPPDPDGGAYIRGDSYDTDARVYYRLLRRDYERDPRPAKGPRSPWRTLPSAWRGP